VLPTLFANPVFIFCLQIYCSTDLASIYIQEKCFTIETRDIYHHFHLQAIWFNVTFLYIGLAAVSITVNLVIANITAQYRKHKAKIKLVKKLEQELNDSDDDADANDVVVEKNSKSSPKPAVTTTPPKNETNDVTKMSDLKERVESDEELNLNDFNDGDDNNNSSNSGFTNGINGL